MPVLYSQLAGDGGTYQTLNMMKTYIGEAAYDPLIRKQAFLATQHCRRTDVRCKCIGALLWTKKYVTFTHDPDRIELLQHPKLFAKAIDEGRRPYGDCDDFSMYLASLLKSVGVRVALRAVGSLDRYYHVFVVCGEMVLDGTVDMGRAARPYTKSKTVEV